MILRIKTMTPNSNPLPNPICKRCKRSFYQISIDSHLCLLCDKRLIRHWGRIKREGLDNRVKG